MADPMAEIKASFFIECDELLEALQDGLQLIENGEQDSDTVNVIFRAVHSIKGGAGAFGLTQLVDFAHRFETVLDELRADRMQIDQSLLALFYQCGDVLSDLVRESRDGVAHDIASVQPVLTALDQLIPADEEDTDDAVDFQPMAVSLDLPDLDDMPLTTDGLPPLAGGSDDTAKTYLIRFVPQQALYTLGNEPVFLLSALSELGTVQVSCDDNAVPPLEDLDPEAGYLCWEIQIQTTKDEACLSEVFEFVEGICALEITTLGTAQPTLCDSIEADLAISPPDPEVAPNLELALPSPAPSPSPVTQATAPAPANDTRREAPRATVRVELERVDRLVNLVGELVINQAMLSQSVDAAGLSANTSVHTGLEEFLQLTRDIQESVMLIRAQPVKSLFQRMSRIVREASRDIGKSVRLRTDGENTEVDKTVIERLADPLTHMIRNAVDHGLETDADRVAAGKPAEGTIELTAAHRSGRVVIEVRDDGNGINRPKVQSIAISKGLVPKDADLTDSEIDNLLFLPGFSTATEVSNLSGRGVGMDVVRSAIQALGGRISIASTPGMGTTFSISLPLTLAVLDGMVVRVADQTLLVPLNAILETQTLSANDIRAFGPETNVICIRDSFVAMLDLGAELGYRAPLQSYVGCVMLLVATEDGSKAAIIVDAIEDQRQVVIKGLQDSYGRIPGIAAATILGDGQIALILDPIDLIANSEWRTRPPSLEQHEVGACNG